MDDSIKVSVIVPTYNRCNTILESVESVLEQSYENLECIIVDDCSDDGTYDVIQRIKDKRIKYIKNNVRLGPSKSRNIGCIHAAGSVIGFNDSDDIWKKQKISIQLETLLKNDDYGMVYCPYLHSIGNRVERKPSYGVPLKYLSGNIFNFLLEGNVIGTPTMLIKKSCFTASGGFDENLKALEDYDLALRISRDYKIGYVNQGLVYAHCIDKGVSSHRINIIDACIIIIDKLKCSNKKNGLYPLLFNNISLLEGQSVKNQMVNRVQYNLKIDKVYLDYALELSEQCMREKRKEQILITMIGLADYTVLWNKYFRSLNVKNIAIYGCGRLGQVLAKQFSELDCCFLGIIDRQVVECKGIPVYSPISIPKETEVIIITVYDSSFKKEELAKKTEAKLLRLDDFLSLLLNNGSELDV